MPEFQDTPALRSATAFKIGVSPENLGANGDLLLDRLLRDTWHEAMILPSSADNPTRLTLVDAELCTDARRSLAIFEDFTEPCGEHVWNPARNIQLPLVDNPAPAILQHLGVDPDQDFDQCISDELLAQLELAMRHTLGCVFAGVDQAFIFDALTNPHRAVVDFSETVRLLRDELPPRLQAWCTDEQLVKAASDLDQPLVASGSCHVQVVDGGRNPHWSCFSSEKLKRRIAIDLRSRGQRHAGNATC